jgi:hypothetical protein
MKKAASLDGQGKRLSIYAVQMRVVPEAGLEPARLAAADFESATSTNSITRATRRILSPICPESATVSPYAHIRQGANSV